MRILHLHNPANVAVQLRDAQRAVGHQALVATLTEAAAWLDYPDDYRFYRGRGPVDFGVFYSKLLNLIWRCDVAHIHGYQYNSFSPYLLRVIRNLGKVLIAHYHGDEVRSGIWRERASQVRPDAMILATPDLLRHCPEGHYIPNPYMSPGVERKPLAKGFRVVHAHSPYANLEFQKGTETIRRVMEGIPEAEFVEVGDTPHDKALEQYATADLAIDQMGGEPKIGWYGMFALECMAMGIPTVGFVDRTLDYENPVHHADESTLGETIRMFMVDQDARRKVGEYQKAFISKHHDPHAVARSVLDVYERAKGHQR